MSEKVFLGACPASTYQDSPDQLLWKQNDIKYFPNVLRTTHRDVQGTTLHGNFPYGTEYLRSIPVINEYLQMHN